MGIPNSPSKSPSVIGRLLFVLILGVGPALVLFDLLVGIAIAPDADDPTQRGHVLPLWIAYAVPAAYVVLVVWIAFARRRTARM
jgi:hypothetical protein